MTPRNPSFSEPTVKAVFDGFEPAIRDQLMLLRGLIFEAGEVSESLKWGQPSYDAGKGGTPIRLGVGKKPNTFGFFVHCQTDLIAQYDALYGSQLDYSGTRGVLFDANAPVPTPMVRHCFELALTYHTRKK